MRRKGAAKRVEWWMAGLCACMVATVAAQTAPELEVEIRVIDADGREQDLEAVVARSEASRVVFIGENHERYDHHLAQLEWIRRLHERAPERWVIGVEFLQRRFQPHLNAYLAGAIDEREFLTATEYFERWGYDYRLYRPIFDYARREGIPMLALNAERELIQQVSSLGLEGLSAEDRARLPREIDPPNDAYRERLRDIFAEHPEGEDFERFVAVQLVWDETMAERIADYLAVHPGRAMIVLAGRGHIEFGDGIPARVERRLPETPRVILLPADEADADPRGADYLLVSTERPLPAVGALGLTLDVSDGVRVRTLSPDGAAAAAGLETGDHILAIDDTPVLALADFRLALIHTVPGASVSVTVRRQGAAEGEEMVFEVVLQ